jgi:hypothetical protein
LLKAYVMPASTPLAVSVAAGAGGAETPIQERWRVKKDGVVRGDGRDFPGEFPGELNILGRPGTSGIGVV